jgi:hypothetical protein
MLKMLSEDTRLRVSEGNTSLRINEFKSSAHFKPRDLIHALCSLKCATSRTDRKVKVEWFKLRWKDVNIPLTCRSEFSNCWRNQVEKVISKAFRLSQQPNSH